MSKFLRLVQENTPGGEAGRGEYTVEYKDSQGNVMAKLTIPNDVGSSYDNFLEFAKVTRGNLEVASEQPVEDAEMFGGQEYDLDSSVRALAGKARSGLMGLGGKIIGTKAQQAKKAVKERDNAVKEALPLFIQRTNELKDGIRKATK
jgi:hypothetical protein